MAKYGSGMIIALAATVEQARADFRVHLHDHYNSLIEGLDIFDLLDPERIAEKTSTLEADIAAEPARKSKTLFIAGSE